MTEYRIGDIVLITNIKGAPYPHGEIDKIIYNNHSRSTRYHVRVYGHDSQGQSKIFNRTQMDIMSIKILKDIDELVKI